MYFFTPFDQSWHGEKIEIDWDYPSTFTLQIVAQSETLGQTSSEVQITDDPFSYPCLSEECRFALPGQPPYHIENSYPELYDMYYVGEIDGYIQEVLITNDEAQIFEEVGSLVVRDISQQVLYIYDVK